MKRIKMNYGKKYFVLFTLNENFSPNVPLTMTVNIFKNVECDSFENPQDLVMIKELHYKNGQITKTKQGCILVLSYYELLQVYHDIELVLKYPESLFEDIP